MNKIELFAQGLDLMLQFGKLNNFVLPMTHQWPKEDRWPFPHACAYYRPNQITICVRRCAHIGTGGASWSFPGYTVDRTPYGVLAHELGHHVDHHMSDRKGRYFGDYSIKMRAEVDEPKLTNYCPNDAEWFAEMFRLFMTNPELLRYLRPRTYAALRRDFEPPEKRAWAQVLFGAPPRTLNAASKKVKLAGGPHE